MSGGSFNYPGSWGWGDMSLQTVFMWKEIVEALERDNPDTPGCVEFVAELKSFIHDCHQISERHHTKLADTLTVIDRKYSGDDGEDDLAEALLAFREKLRIAPVDPDDEADEDYEKPCGHCGRIFMTSFSGLIRPCLGCGDRAWTQEFCSEECASSGHKCAPGQVFEIDHGGD